jgi:FkbM family methyltransferase
MRLNLLKSRTNPYKALRLRYHRTMGSCPARLNGEYFRCDPEHWRFWEKASTGRWEPQTYNILSKFLTSSSVYCDVGAWIGPTVLYAARQCRKVICFEPDFVAYRYLLWNLELNRLTNVTPFNVAISESPGMVQMAGPSETLGDSCTSLLGAEDRANAFEVLGLSWDRWMDLVRPEPIDFMKIDIEGFEFDLLPRIADFLADRKPIVFLSTHGQMVDEAQQEESMQRIVDVMRPYQRCLDPSLRDVAWSELTQKPICGTSRELLFLP